MRERTLALVAKATGKPCPQRRTEAPDLTIQPATASATSGQLVDNTASPADAGRSLTVALNEQSAATVRVQITGTGQISVEAALPYRLEAGTV